MQIMVNSAESGIICSKLSNLVGVLVAYCRTREHDVIKIAVWVVDMKFEWVDPDDGPWVVLAISIRSVDWNYHIACAAPGF